MVDSDHDLEAPSRLTPRVLILPRLHFGVVDVANVAIMKSMETNTVAKALGGFAVTGWGLVVSVSIRPSCTCRSKFAPIECGSAATIVVRRTCRKCRALWTLTVRPSKRGDGIHVAQIDGVCLSGAKHTVGNPVSP